MPTITSFFLPNNGCTSITSNKIRSWYGADSLETIYIVYIYVYIMSYEARMTMGPKEIAGKVVATNRVPRVAEGYMIGGMPWRTASAVVGVVAIAAFK